MNKPIPYGRQHINEDDIKIVVETLTSDFLTQGPKVAEFEKDFANYVGAKFAVAVSNATAALHISALAMLTQKGTNVITTPLTFAASANCVRYCGGNVFFCDIDPNTYLIDLKKLRSLLESKPPGFFSGVIPVHLAGLSLDMEALRVIADEFKLWIIEDACHAPGGYFKDSEGREQKCGNGKFAEVSVFSFHPVKHIATGEGGMVTTNDKKLYDKLCLLRSHGISRNPEWMTENHGGWYYQMLELGFNYRMPDILCALGISQLKRANEGLEIRRQIAKKYNSAFQSHPNISIQNPNLQDGHAFHLYIIRTKQRSELYNFLRTKNIFAQVHYIPLHTMPYYQGLGYKMGDFPVAEMFYSECLSLPMYPTLSDGEQEYVINTIIEFFNQ